MTDKNYILWPCKACLHTTSPPTVSRRSSRRQNVNQTWRRICTLVHTTWWATYQPPRPTKLYNYNLFIPQASQPQYSQCSNAPSSFWQSVSASHANNCVMSTSQALWHFTTDYLNFNKQTGMLTGRGKFSGGRGIVREMFGGCPRNYPRGKMFRVNVCGIVRGNVSIPMQHYKYPHAVAMICDTLVNTQTHTETNTERQLLTSYTISYYYY